MAFAQAAVQMTAAEQQAYKRRWIALLILSMSLMLIVIDSTIVNIAFPAIRSTFGASYADAEWINSIYSLVFGALLITWGKLGDQYGRRNIFIGGAVVFALGSLGVGTASTIGVTIAFRALQGLGAAMMSPSTLSIISGTFKGKERGIAFGIWGATAGVSAAVGPILGGWLIEYGTGIMAESWRLAFLINIPIAVIAIAGSFWAIRESRDPNAKPKIDFVGIVLITVSLGLIVFGAIEGQNYGWLEAKKVFTLGPITYPTLASGVTAVPAGTASFIPFVFLAGIIALVLFIFIEMRQERSGGQPLFEFALLKYRSFRFGLLTISIATLGEFGTFLVLSLYMQIAKQMGAFETGVELIAAAGAMVITAPLAGALSGRFGAKWIVTLGMALEAVALFWMSRVLYFEQPLSALTPALILYGAGFGLSIAQLANLVLSDIPGNKAGVASGAVNTIRQVGAALGIALIGAIMFGTFATASTPLVQNSTAFSDFSADVAARTDISAGSHTLATLIGTFGDTAKQQIITALNNNEGFDSSGDALDLLISNAPPIAKTGLKLQGVDLDNAEQLAQIRTELKPNLDKLGAGIQEPLGIGFAEAGRAATGTAAIFVVGGAIASLLLPKATRARATEGEEVAVMAH
ncbi:MAG: MFS transporter [Chloroflexota bacterium]